MVYISLSQECSLTLTLDPVTRMPRGNPFQNHEACPARKVQPGVIGGWVCSCECHAPKETRANG